MGAGELMRVNRILMLGRILFIKIPSVIYLFVGSFIVIFLKFI